MTARTFTLTLTLAVAATLALGVAAAGCGQRSETAQCERLLDKTVELYAAPRGLKLLPAEQKAHYDASLVGLRKKMGAGFVARCRRDYPPASVACQLQARTLDQLTKCWPAP